MPNIRWTDRNESTTTRTSDGSDRTNVSMSSTVPTEYEYDHGYDRPPLKQHHTFHEPTRREKYVVELHNEKRGPSESIASVDTYASTDEEEEEEELEDDYPEYQVPTYAYTPYPSDAVAASPRDFADYFPSSKRLWIRHDDATLDGNMNLRIDTQVETRRGKKINLTLFHLRMHDLRSRDFSLRRYCRDSGREVCHCIRKYQKTPAERPALQRSFSSALAPFRMKNESRPSTAVGLKRSDSGYASIQTFNQEVPTPTRSKRKLIPTNTVKMEFSNYAHVDVKRRGAKSTKRYVLEYWDVKYVWKRCVNNINGQEHVSFHLVRDGTDHEMAHIVPIAMSQAQRHEEAQRGGWIPPCNFRLVDESLINSVPDVSDIIVASGLMALVDDCIKRHFHTKQSTQLHIPLFKNKFNVDYVGPKRLIDEMFNRTTRKATSGNQQNRPRRLSAAT